MIEKVYLKVNMKETLPFKSKLESKVKLHYPYGYLRLTVKDHCCTRINIEMKFSNFDVQLLSYKYILLP